MDIELIVDHREKNVFAELDVVFNQINHLRTSGLIGQVREQLTIGDYMIKAGDEVFAVLERKTLKDFAASIKDGRMDNTQKMLNFRENSNNCTLYYIIEGNNVTDYNRLISNIKYKCILSFIRKMEINDNIHVLWTKNKLQTANELKFLCEVFSKMLVNTEIAGNYQEVLDKSQLSDEDKQKNQLLTAWKSQKGIGLLAGDYLAKNYTLSDLINKEIPIDIKINNRGLTKAVKESLQNPDMLKLFAALPGISKNTAFMFLSNHKVDEFDINTLQDVVLNKKKFGKKRADKIIDLLTLKLE